jgi:hypothetical protein
MTDFYENPPKTKQDIRDYLTTWLQKTGYEEPDLEVNGEKFIQELSFRRAFHNHFVYRSTSTNEYVWWVVEDAELIPFPKKRYAKYEELLENVVNDYYVGWGLSE